MVSAGLLLAAGAGRRIGGPKALVRRRAGLPTFVEATVDALWRAGLPRVVVVLGAGADQALPLVESAGAEAVVAPDWAEGMGASLRAGLAYLSDAARGVPDAARGVPDAARGVPDAARGVPDVALVMLVDLPDVGVGVHRRVLAAAAPEGPAALVRATYDGRPGHPVALGRDHWVEVTDVAHGDRGARHLLASADTRAVECGDLASGRDVDTAAALDAVPTGAPHDAFTSVSDEVRGGRRPSDRG
ncbi:MAG: nucleotidyltransferase family protein [Phycicoccus sp.]